MPVVLVHKNMGVYLGSAMGLGFWTRLDPVGQDAAVCIENENHARTLIHSWDNRLNEDEFSFVPVSTASPNYATIDELKEAGLQDHLGDMEEDASRYGS